jgi:peptidoglycan/xylan/chitin deacetylase (PgdA/CDA1 family)
MVTLGDLGPIITFSYDDFPRSALETGADIVERFGGRATYYVSMSLMGTNNDLGEQFSSADLRTLVERGHEVANHTYNHLSARSTPIEEFLEDAYYGEETIRESIGLSASNNFAYPYGEVTLATKKQLGRRMKSCRGTCRGLNGPDVDLNLLRANHLYGGIDQCETAKRMIVENEKQNAWLIFYTHDVRIDPSQYGCTPALLTEVLSFAADHCAKIVTVAETVDKLGCSA